MPGKASFVTMYAGVIPAVDPVLSFRMGLYGIDMVDVPGGPRTIDLGAEGDLEVARTFVGHALRRIDELTAQYFAAEAEYDLEVMSRLEHPHRRDLPSHHILGAPGWRAVDDSGDPAVAASECIRYVEHQTWERDHREALVGFYREPPIAGRATAARR